MTAKITFFPVGNGDMTLIALESGRKILIDLNIRADADDPNDTTPDVAKQLRERLERDESDRLFVDALLVSHPDKDHCTGLAKHFHLGSASDWSKALDKILIRELWSSPMVFRRASKNHILCEDAKAFSAEARRRVKYYKDGNLLKDGERILILGEDQDGKSDGLDAILVRVDNQFSKVNGSEDWSMIGRLLAPIPKSDDDTEETLSKNHSSTIIQFSLTGDGHSDMCRFLTGGDAEVAIWERLWTRHEHRRDWLSYDVMQTPHHCSWHTLSYDSWSEKGEDAQVCHAAKEALSQSRGNAIIVASSKPIKADDCDPPCTRAKREYVTMAEQFLVTMEHPKESAPAPLEIKITQVGCTVIKQATIGSATIISRPAPRAG